MGLFQNKIINFVKAASWIRQPLLFYHFILINFEILSLWHTICNQKDKTGKESQAGARETASGISEDSRQGPSNFRPNPQFSPFLVIKPVETFYGLPASILYK